MEVRSCSFREAEASSGFCELVAEYARETSSTEIAEPKVQFERYHQLDEAGVLRFLGVFDREKLVGCAILTINETQHYDFPLVAVESIYLRKDYRRGRAGLKLMRLIKDTVVLVGAPGCTFMAPPSSALDSLCSLLGMVHTHNCYWCRCL